MLAKIAGIGLVATLAVALVAGSAYILLRPSEVEAGQGGPHADCGCEHQEGWQAGDGYHGGAGHDHGEGGEHPDQDWTTVTGTVVALDHDLVLRTEEGELVVHLGPEWHWESVGIPLEPGDQVAVVGFYEGDGFEAASIENLTAGQVVVLRDEAGHPRWAGRGRGSSGGR